MEEVRYIQNVSTSMGNLTLTDIVNSRKSCVVIGYGHKVDLFEDFAKFGISKETIENSYTLQTAINQKQLAVITEAEYNDVNYAHPSLQPIPNYIVEQYTRDLKRRNVIEHVEANKYDAAIAVSLIEEKEENDSLGNETMQIPNMEKVIETYVAKRDNRKKPEGISLSD